MLRFRQGRHPLGHAGRRTVAPQAPQHLRDLPFADPVRPPGEPFAGASEAVIADLNGDGAPEVIFTTYSSGTPGHPDSPAHLVVLNGNGVLLHSVEVAGRGAMSEPTVADVDGVDGDGKVEIILSLKDALGEAPAASSSGTSQARPRTASCGERAVAAGCGRDTCQRADGSSLANQARAQRRVTEVPRRRVAAPTYVSSGRS